MFSPLLLVLLLKLAACSKPESTSTAAETGGVKEKFCISDTLRNMIAIDTVRLENVQDNVTLTGEVSFDLDKVVRVMPLTSGQVLDVKVSLGDYVQRGQTLAVMKSSEIVSNYSDQSAARADLAIAKKNMDAAESLFKSGMAAEKDFQNAKEEYEKALSAVQRSTEVGKIYGAGNAAGEVLIKAPISGFIVEKKVNTGMQIRPDNADNLFTISDLKEVWVLANVFESDIARVQPGMQANISTLAYPDKIFTGKVDQVSQVLDPQNKTEKVRIRIQNTGNLLKPEMFTSVSIVGVVPQRAMEVPSAAVIFDYGKQYVVTYKDACNVAVKEVTPIKTQGGKTYLKSGVQPGDLLISKNQILVYNAFKE